MSVSDDVAFLGEWVDSLYADDPLPLGPFVPPKDALDVDRWEDDGGAS